MPSLFIRPSLLAIALLTSLALHITAVQAATFQGLGHLPGGTYSFTAGSSALSADGSTVVVGGDLNSDLYEHASIWTATGGMVAIDTASRDSYGSAASADGTVVVGEGADEFGAFRWTSASGVVGIGDLPDGFVSSGARSVSADGSIIAGYGSGTNGTEAFRWTSADGMVGLGDLPGGEFDSGANGISADGSTIVGVSASSNGDSEAFRWTSVEGMVGLGDVSGGSFSSTALGISADGSVIIGRGVGASGSEAFRWTSAAGMVGLGDLPGGDFSSTAYGVSADGSRIVGTATGLNGEEAFLWDAINGMQSLASLLTTSGIDLTGWTLGSASGISADGSVIAGTGEHDGITEAWIVTGFALVPEPTTWALLAVGTIFVLWRMQRQTKASSKLSA